MLFCRSAFTGRSLSPYVAPAASRNQRKAPSKFGVRAYEWHEYDPNEELAELDIREWPYKKFVQETLEAFPEKAIADVEETRVSTTASQAQPSSGTSLILSRFP